MTLAVLTPSYSVDYPLCVDLHRSVLEFTRVDVIHHIVVPDADVPMFQELAGDRCKIWSERSVLPRRIRQTPRINRLIRKFGRLPPSTRVAAINVRRPYPPIRGWILQQVLKIQMATEIGSEVVLLMDSDVELIRPTNSASFRNDGSTLLYKSPGAVRADMTDHARWHQVACNLLGIPVLPLPQPDYISSFMAWDMKVVAAMRQRIEHIARRPWLDVVAGQLHLSEWTLYGIYADRLYLGGSVVSGIADSRCHELWGTTPLTESTAVEFGSSVQQTDLAMMISAKTRTPHALRRRAVEVARNQT